ncbi:hypothetical protein [Streptomyces adelaidensis]|uniref:hypothetical protein n=1 Tax=Streptomyces adelaidensis TaxID=2796465 RepID=UPI001907DD49|nr:hypothetical protein [Streptomyces adelaidensis]
MRARTGVSGVAAVAAILGLAACTGGDGGDEPPELGTVPTVKSSADLPTLPMEQYVFSGDDLRTYTQAGAVLSRRCMERFGMNWISDEDATRDLPDLTVDPTRYFTIIDARTAREHGYGDPGADGGDQQEKTGGSYEPTAAERSVYDGSAKDVTDTAGRRLGEGGCAAESDGQLEKGGVKGIEPLKVGNEFYTLYGEVQRDSRVTEAFEKWSECMKKEGFSYATPLDAANDSEWASGGDTKAAISVATADVACKQRLNTVGTWYAVTEAYQRAYIDEKAEHFADILATKQSLVKNAANVIGGTA